MSFVIDAEALKHGEKVFRQECRFIAGAQHAADFPPPGLPEIAFAGRSNVGKSSLINALTGRKGLARSSSTPGRTQQINFFDLGGRLHLVDLPGYGHAVASKDKIAAWSELIRSYLRTRNTLKRVCILIDSRHGIKAADQVTMEKLGEAGVPYLVILTKCDKRPVTAPEGLKERIEEELKGYPIAFQTVYETSSSSSQGIQELRAILAAG